MINNGSFRSFTKFFVFNVERFNFTNGACFGTVWHIFCVCVNNDSPRSLMCLFPTFGSLLSSDERASTTLVSLTGLSVLSEETGSSSKELTSISWERDVFLPSCTVLASSLITDFVFLWRYIIGWFDWKLLDNCPTSDRWPCSEHHSLSTRVSRRSVEENEVTCIFSRKWLRQFPS